MNSLAEKLRIAQQLTNRGFGLFLLKPKTKLPLESGWQQQATNHFETFRTRLEAYPNCNIGVATGSKWGLCVLDIDPRHGGNDALMRLEKANGLLPETFVVQTGGNGLHYYFAAPAGVEVKNSAGIIGDGIDTRGDGGYVVGPGSEHESGRLYAILSSPCELSRAQYAEMGRATVPRIGKLDAWGAQGGHRLRKYQRGVRLGLRTPAGHGIFRVNQNYANSLKPLVGDTGLEPVTR